MAFQIEGRAVLQAGLKDRRESLDQQFEAHLVHVGNRMPAQRLGSGGNRNQWLQQWAGEPTKPETGTTRSCKLADEVRQPHGAD